LAGDSGWAWRIGWKRLLGGLVLDGGRRELGELFLELSVAVYSWHFEV